MQRLLERPITCGPTWVRRYSCSAPVAALGSFSPGTSTRERTCTAAIHTSEIRHPYLHPECIPQDTTFGGLTDENGRNKARCRRCDPTRRIFRQGSNELNRLKSQIARSKHDNSSRARTKMYRYKKDAHLGGADGVEEDGGGLGKHHVPKVGVRQGAAAQQEANEVGGVRDARRRQLIAQRRVHAVTHHLRNRYRNE